MIFGIPQMQIGWRRKYEIYGIWIYANLSNWSALVMLVMLVKRASSSNQHACPSVRVSILRKKKKKKYSNISSSSSKVWPELGIIVWFQCRTCMLWMGSVVCSGDNNLLHPNIILIVWSWCAWSRKEDSSSLRRRNFFEIFTQPTSQRSKSQLHDQCNWGHTRSTLWLTLSTLKDNSEIMERTRRKHAENMQRTCRELAENMQKTCRKPAENL